MRVWRHLPWLLLGSCAATVVDYADLTPGPADLVVTNARVVTLDPFRPEAEALAVSAGRFRVVGSIAQVRPFVGPETKMVDAGGAVLLPGFIDAHLHLLGEGQRLMRLDLVGTTSKDDVLGRVRAEAERRRGEGWIRGRGWDQNDWPETQFPTAADLDRVVGDRPVVLTRIDGHAIWVNSRTLALAGIGPDTGDPPGGKLLRDAAGRPSGVLIDNAMALVTDKVPPATREEKREAARLGAHECVAHGLVGVHEPGLGGEEIEILKDLARDRALPLRVYVMLSPGEALERYLAAGPEVGLFNQRLTVRAVKFYADGALGSRGAALLADYADAPGDRGLLTIGPAELERQVRRAVMSGLQPCVHAIGDRGNREVLDVFERVLSSGGEHALPGGVRPRIEHAQVLAPADLKRFAKLGVIASFQPTHATSDMPWAEARLGRDRVQGAYAWRSLLDSGAHVAFGSDAPVESVDPLWGLYAAVTRQDHAGQPPGGWHPEQRVSIDEALQAFTSGAAYAAFEEELKGAITPGRLADFVILSDDPRKVAAAKLLELKVLATYVGGEPVYQSGGK